jgi:epoxyqueuosine reductase
MNANSVSRPLRVAPIWLREVKSSRGIDSEWVKMLARECGLDVAAISGPEPFVGLEGHLHQRIEDGHFKGFSWFTSERASVSADPSALHSSVRSIVAVGLPYFRSFPELPGDGALRGRIARYAWGADYHIVLKRRMADLLARLEDRAGRPIEARLLVDTARIVDRAVAGRSGLGWYGKHSCIIVPGYGSWVLLGELLLDLDLEQDAPLDRNCGQCRACLDRCPTGAIVAPYELDSGLCISFQTIEQRGAIPIELRARFGNWVFGCDECQDVCPYTSAAQESFDRELEPQSLRNVAPELDWLVRMTEQEFRGAYRGTAVLRAKRRGLARNAAIALGNAGNDRAISLLIEALTSHDEPLVRGHAAWGLSRYEDRQARLGLERALSTEVDEFVLNEIRAALAGGTN